MTKEPKNCRIAPTCATCRKSTLKGPGIKNSGLWCKSYFQWVNPHRVCDSHS